MPRAAAYEHERKQHQAEEDEGERTVTEVSAAAPPRQASAVPLGAHSAPSPRGQAERVAGCRRESGAPPQALPNARMTVPATPTPIRPATQTRPPRRPRRTRATEFRPPPPGGSRAGCTRRAGQCPPYQRVVPDQNALLHEQRPVHVGGASPVGGARALSRSRADAGGARREQHFTARGDESGDGGGHRARRSLHVIDSGRAPADSVAVLGALAAGCGGEETVSPTARPWRLSAPPAPLHRGRGQPRGGRAGVYEQRLRRLSYVPAGRHDRHDQPRPRRASRLGREGRATLDEFVLSRSRTRTATSRGFPESVMPAWSGNEQDLASLVAFLTQS